ncbi:MAG: histidinol dehydrogenase, partial [Sphingomonadales bacterium]|nr:histidinol dehydrogenase [Sphingomonadales bacterium]
MRRLAWSDLDSAERAAALRRPEARANAALHEAVRATIEEVRIGGWDALCRIAETIDGTTPACISVSDAASDARERLSPAEIAAIELAADNIAVFHRASRPQPIEIETRPGLVVRQLWRPIERVGLYVPG